MKTLCGIALIGLAVAATAAPRVFAQSSDTPKSIAGCPAEPLAFHTCALQKAKTFNPPRLPSGRPNLQGFWRGNALTQAFSVEGVASDDPMIKDPIMPWEAAPPEVIDPPDRKIPYQPWAAAIGRRGVNFHKYLDPRTSCSTAGIPRLALQDASQIVQPPTDDYLLWQHDDHHAYRVIAMGDRPPVGAAIKTWHGLSRGRWEGNTLVIDTTNLNGYIWIDDSGNFYTDTAHLVERVTMVDANTIDYEVTFEDPKVYTRPWKVAWVLQRVMEPGFELIEEACIEGERSMEDIRQQGGYRWYFGESWKFYR